MPGVVTAVQQEAHVPFHLSDGIWAHGVQSAHWTGSWLSPSGTQKPCRSQELQSTYTCKQVLGRNQSEFLGSAVVAFHQEVVGVSYVRCCSNVTPRVSGSPCQDGFG